MKKFRAYLTKFKKPSWNYEQYRAISYINKFVNKSGNYAKQLVYAPILIKPLLNYLQNYDAGDPNDPNHWNTEKVRNKVVEVLGKLGKTAIEPLIKSLSEKNSWMIVELLGKFNDSRVVQPLIACLKKADRYLQEEIISLLGVIGEKIAVEPLLECLKAEIDTVQIATAEALGKIGDLRAVESLIKCLQDKIKENSFLPPYYRYPALEETIIWALSELGDLRAVQTLIECLSHKDKWVRQASARALGKFKTTEILEPLLQCVNDPAPEVRRLAIRSLGILNYKRIVDPLIEFLKTVKYPTRIYIIEALGKLGDLKSVEILIEQLKLKRRDYWIIIEALGRLGDQRAVEPILSCLDNNTPWWLKRIIVRVLGKLRDTRAVKPLITLLKEDEDIRPWIIDTLCKLSPPPTEFLIECLKYPISEVRENVAWALGQIGDKMAIMPLIQCLGDSSPFVITRTTESLSKLGAIEAINRLIAFLRVDDDNWAYKFSRVFLGFSPDDLKNVPNTEDTVVMIMKALGDLGDKNTINFLYNYLWVESDIVRFIVEEAIYKLKDSNIIERLIEQLEESDTWIRLVAAEALGKLKDRKAVGPLLQILKDQDKQVRKKVVIALGKIGDPKAIDPLIACFQINNYSAWREITWALGELGNMTIDPLINCLKDKNNRVRGLALEVIGRIGDPRTLEFLIPYLEDVNEDVQEIALKAINKIPYNKNEEEFLTFNKLIEHLEHHEIDQIWSCLKDINKLIDSTTGKLNYEIYESLEALTRFFWEAHEITREMILELFVKLVGRIDFYFIELFENCLKDKNFAIRRIAAEGIRRIEDIRASSEI
ncbi:MAG: HEAT repeat domain-containing protein [Promethearchaeota archaeon]